MSLPRFVLGFLATLLAFAATSFFLTGSVWKTFLGTLLCALVIQVGYFLIVLFFVLRNPKPGADTSHDIGTKTSQHAKVETTGILRRSRDS